MRSIVPESLWIGNAIDARDVTAVLAAGITAILDIALEERPIQFPREIVYCRVPLVDGQGNSPLLLQTAVKLLAEFIETRIPTLVCCGAGMSRSPALVATALSVLSDEAPEDILLRVVGDGPRDVSPPLWTDLVRVAQTLRSQRQFVSR